MNKNQSSIVDSAQKLENKSNSKRVDRRMNHHNIIATSLIVLTTIIVVIFQTKFNRSKFVGQFEDGNSQNPSQLPPSSSPIQLHHLDESRNIYDNDLMNQTNPPMAPFAPFLNISRSEKVDIVPRFSFFVMGDTPYNRKDEILLSEQISDINRESKYAAESFVVHVGDLMQSTSCSKRRYKKAHNILNNTNLPLLVVPGDNDWNDCPNPNVALNRFKRYFIDRIDVGQAPFQLHRQNGRKENFSFWHHGVLFLGLNLIGKRNNKWEGRYKDILKWFHSHCDKYLSSARAVVIFAHSLKAESVYDEITNRLRSTEIPVLVLHGNGHKYTEMINGNILKIQVDRGGMAPPLKITIKGDCDISELRSEENQQIVFADLFKIDRRK